MSMDSLQTAFVVVNQVKAICSTTLCHFGVSAVQISKLFDAIDTLPKYIAVPVSSSGFDGTEHAPDTVVAIPHELSVDVVSDGVLESVSVPNDQLDTQHESSINSRDSRVDAEAVDDTCHEDSF